MKSSHVFSRASFGPWGWAAGCLVLMLSWVLSVEGQATGGSYRMSGQLVGGGGVSQGGRFALRGIVTTGAAGRSVTAGEPGGVPSDFRVVGGWIGNGLALNQDRPVMRVLFTEDKLAQLSWDIDIAAAGYVLEFSSSLGDDADWQPVNPQPIGLTFTTPCQQPARYFRLRGL